MHHFVCSMKAFKHVPSVEILILPSHWGSEMLLMHLPRVAKLSVGTPKAVQVYIPLLRNHAKSAFSGRALTPTLKLFDPEPIFPFRPVANTGP